MKKYHTVEKNANYICIFSINSQIELANSVQKKWLSPHFVEENLIIRFHFARNHQRTERAILKTLQARQISIIFKLEPGSSYSLFNLNSEEVAELYHISRIEVEDAVFLTDQFATVRVYV